MSSGSEHSSRHVRSVSTGMACLLWPCCVGPAVVLAGPPLQRLLRPGSQEQEHTRRQDLKNWDGQIKYVEAEQAEKARAFASSVAHAAVTQCCLRQPLQFPMQMSHLQILAPPAFAWAVAARAIGMARCAMLMPGKGARGQKSQRPDPYGCLGRAEGKGGRRHGRGRRCG